jgi:metal-sulfur cluster biosynthetic enzyme
MTLTTRACPVGEVLVSAVWHVASAAPGIRKAEVKLVWDPPWSLERISDNLRQNSDLF